ncbi:hypothetical protein [Micromonospora sp. WMMD980]|uniref:hypothetical protein n=1 Tax=Micromonospora sp. WMMD980 TaxID=3016088 RepID=UPI002416202E|nr:hypothetical protein [Micromonospora sp. WMMD980]MDG4798950.1 hypothetical protein [Micromonospora sp. WMMD980]MDG4798977.1 hypothetical protein [Micromonospora sp. WMMD980]MDG4799016.1 hypothetical protein [Micromonospora sp. WMMD980]
MQTQSTPIIRRDLHTSPASLAAALRSAADQLDLMGHVEISPIALQLNLQAVAHQGTFEQRKDTIDALGIALVGEPGVTEDCDGPYHRLPFEHRGARGDCDIALYTASNDSRRGGAR